MSTEVSASPSAAATSRQLLGEVFGSFIRFFRETHSRSVEEAARRARMTPERWQAAEDGMQLIEELPAPTSYYLLGGYLGVAGTYLALHEGADPQQRKLLALRVPKACRAMGRYARTLPLGGPSACRCKGLALWLHGKRKAALRAWAKGLRLATRLEMPYEEALAHLEIGQRLPVGHPEHDAHLTRACELFTALDTPFDLDRARRLLSQ